MLVPKQKTKAQLDRERANIAAGREEPSTPPSAADIRRWEKMAEEQLRKQNPNATQEQLGKARVDAAIARSRKRNKMWDAQERERLKKPKR